MNHPEVQSGSHRETFWDLWDFLMPYLFDPNPDVVRDHLSALSQCTQVRKTAELLRILLKIRKTADLEKELDYKRIEKDEISSLMKQHGIAMLVLKLLEKPWDNRFALSLLLSIIPKRYLQAEHAYGKMSDLGLVPAIGEVKPYHENWFLCGDIEWQIYDAIFRRTGVKINDGLVVQTVTKMSGLCFRWAETPEQIFVPGVLYSAVDPDLKAKIKAAADCGQTQLANCSGTWAVMRPLRDPGPYGFPVYPMNEILSLAANYP
jgi:hypothetical protein